MADGEWYQDKIATVSGRHYPDSWPWQILGRHLRQTTRTGECSTGNGCRAAARWLPRRGPTFRYQQIAEELINPAVDQVFIEGKAPVSIFEDIGPQVTEAQQVELERAAG